MFKRLIGIPLKSKKSFFLFGPRGAGKTIWLKKHLPNTLFKQSIWTIVDEIQRVPDLLNEIHDLIESKKLTCILTGSSARKLRNKGGICALTYFLHPLTAKEQANSFNLPQSV